MNWLSAQVEEIEKSRALIFFGVGLALINAVTFYAWNGGEFPARFMFASSSNAESICWPILGGCQHLHLLGDTALIWLSRIYLALAVISAGLFAFRRVEIGYLTLAAVTVIKLWFYAQDYRFGGEIHYLATVVTLFYLLVPAKVGGMRLLLTAAYVFAGLAHLNSGWITGDGLSAMFTARGAMKWTWDHGLWTPGAAYVALLLSVGSLGLMTRRRWWFAAAFAQLALLHLIARPLLGDAATLIAFALLAIFPLAWFTEPEPDRYSLPGLVVVSLFCLLQILPWVTPGDHLLTGEGRLGAITMFDGGRTCRSAIIAQFDHRVVDLSRDNQAAPQWLGCDPYVNLRQLQHVCTHLRADRDFLKLSWQMHARRGQTRDYREIVQLDDVCRADVRYAWLGLNSWVKR